MSCSYHAASPVVNTNWINYNLCPRKAARGGSEGVQKRVSSADPLDEITRPIMLSHFFAPIKNHRFNFPPHESVNIWAHTRYAFYYYYIFILGEVLRRVYVKKISLLSSTFNLSAQNHPQGVYNNNKREERASSHRIVHVWMNNTDSFPAEKSQHYFPETMSPHSIFREHVFTRTKRVELLYFARENSANGNVIFRHKTRS